MHPLVFETAFDRKTIGVYLMKPIHSNVQIIFVDSYNFKFLVSNATRLC